MSELLALSQEILRVCRVQFPNVDHVELFGSPKSPGCDARNFVLCPGGMYDRSPCGTGTSAKLACLAADGKLAPNEPWVQESIIGSSFIGTYQWSDTERTSIVPTITGRAFVNSDTQVLVDEQDPFAWGF
jgi:proline racemase